jgi:hypothetical protein
MSLIGFGFITKPTCHIGIPFCDYIPPEGMRWLAKTLKNTMNISYLSQPVMCSDRAGHLLLWTFGGPQPHSLVRLWAWGGVDTSSVQLAPQRKVAPRNTSTEGDYI